MKQATVIRIVVVLAVVIALEAVSRSGWVRVGLLTPPSAMAAELWSLMQTSMFWHDVGFSARATVTAFVLAMIVGCTLAVILHGLPRLRDAVEPLIASYYALPFFALYPLFVVLMGMNQSPIILLGFLYGVVAVIVGTLNGLDRIPVVLRRTGKIYRLSGLRQACFISLPAAAPHIFTGGKLAFGYAITGVLGSEFILANAGFGYDISYAYNNFEDKKMYAFLLFLLIAISILTMLIYRAEGAVQHRSGPARASSERSEASRLSKALATLCVAVVLLIVWQGVHEFAGTEALAPPLQTVEHLWAMAGTAAFWGHVAETAKAICLALLLSCVAGTLGGVLIGTSLLASEVASPLLVTLYALPKVALYPLVLLFFGIGLPAKVVFGAMYGMIPMMLIAMNAIRSMNKSLPKTARVLRLSKAQTIGTVIIPAIVPELVTGIRVSFSITFLGVMIGEMFASSRGLGYLIMNSIDISDTATMMAVTILIATFAVAVNMGLMAAERSISKS
jgi:ABC-type nitrate/sulfonate/bicarbonate transport system permease component